MKRRNPAYDARPLVGIGRFINLTVDGKGGERIITPAAGQQLWLAWKGDPERGDMIVVEAGKRVKVSDDETAKLHREFHGEDPAAWSQVQWHPPHQPLERMGLALSVTYAIPRRMPSNKGSAPDERKEWLHHFGDFGTFNDQRHDPKFRPAVARGPDGSLYLLRRPGNKYRLADWLVG